jgi:orotate phosphoribosyltransferase-like protein
MALRGRLGVYGRRGLSVRKVAAEGGVSVRTAVWLIVKEIAQVCHLPRV